MNTLEAEIKKLESDIENMKQDMNTSANQAPESPQADLSIEAPLQPANTAIGDVIAELKAHNVAKTIQRAQKHKSGTHRVAHNLLRRQMPVCCCNKMHDTSPSFQT